MISVIGSAATALTVVVGLFVAIKALFGRAALMKRLEQEVALLGKDLPQDLRGKVHDRIDATLSLLALLDDHGSGSIEQRKYQKHATRWSTAGAVLIAASMVWAATPGLLPLTGTMFGTIGTAAIVLGFICFWRAVVNARKIWSETMRKASLGLDERHGGARDAARVTVDCSASEERVKELEATLVLFEERLSALRENVHSEDKRKYFVFRMHANP